MVLMFSILLLMNLANFNGIINFSRKKNPNFRLEQALFSITFTYNHTTLSICIMIFLMMGICVLAHCKFNFAYFMAPVINPSTSKPFSSTNVWILSISSLAVDRNAISNRIACTTALVPNLKQFDETNTQFYCFHYEKLNPMTKNLHNFNAFMFRSDKLEHQIKILLLDQCWLESRLFVLQLDFIGKNELEVILK